MSTTGVPTAIGPEAYRSWRATSLGAITEAIEQHLILDLMGPVSGARVLDAGCGDGALVCALASRGAAVTGVDPDPAMLAAARTQAERAGLEVTFADGRVEQLPFADGSFDVVAAVTVLCFVPDAAAAMSEIVRVLRPGGCLVLGELGRWSLWAVIRRVRSWLGAATWKAARFRTAGELRTLAERAGLCVTRVRGAIFYPPVGLCARALAPLDPWLTRLTTAGAAFVALSAIRPSEP
ncbi:MAG TPA: class I SAM-dependent methyltransferase [Steroidobacteraceae bacterium]|nr:class I SAM-dependent methyltransferase [Steroidobacteraceae bacterium]